MGCEPRRAPSIGSRSSSSLCTGVVRQGVRIIAVGDQGEAEDALREETPTEMTAAHRVAPVGEDRRQGVDQP